MKLRALLPTLALVVLASSAARADFTLGDYYGTDPDLNTVVHYSQAGAILGQFSVAPTSSFNGLGGLAYNPSDGLMYVSSADSNGNLVVRSFTSNGRLQQTYNAAAPIGGNISFGKITFDGANHFYVGTAAGIETFTAGGPATGTLLYNPGFNGVYDMKFLSNGNLVVASDYNVTEITTSGTLVRTFLNSSGYPNFVNIRGLAYDASSNSLFVSVLGYTDNFFQIEKFNYGTGTLLGSTTYTYADSLATTLGGQLLVGSRTQAPALFTQDLTLVRQFSGGNRLFMTQVTPEPASLAMLALGLGSALAVARRRAAR